MSNERYSRQADIVPRDRILDCKATVIGVGAIGRQVALQLTAIGVPHLQLVDFDTVEISNLASQGFLHKDLERPKVDATAEFAREMNSDLTVEVIFERFKRSTPVGNSVFCCVDSIVVRKLIWEAVKDKVNFFVDGRMSAEVLRVIKSGGRFVIIETSQPKVWLIRKLNHLYLRCFVFWLGYLISGNRAAYSYLVESSINYYSP